jgi:lactate racemase
MPEGIRKISVSTSSQKTPDNARYAAKKGGVVVILAECPDIAELSEYFNGFKYPDVYEQEKALRENDDLPGRVALRHSECCRDNQVILLTRPGNGDDARTARLHPVFSMEEALKVAYKKCGLDRPKIAVMPFVANTFPLLSGQS